MPVTIVTTSVGAIDSLEFGQTVAFNEGYGAAPKGIDSSIFGNSGRVVDSTQPGYNIAFDFTLLAAPPPNTNNFFFDNKSVLATVGGTDFSSFGSAVIANAALSFTPQPWESLSIPSPRVLDPSISGSSVDFNFTEFYEVDTEQGRAILFWGPWPLLPSEWDSLQLGVPEVTTTLGFFPSGWQLSKFGNPRISYPTSTGRNVEFNFVSSDDVNSPNFFFGNKLGIRATGSDLQNFGTTTITNAAQGAFVQGIGSLNISDRTWILPSGAAVDFYFYDSTYISPSANNVPFYFWGTRSIGFYGFDSSEFGSHNIAGWLQEIQAWGYRPTQFGDLLIENWAEFAVQGQGWTQMAFGQPTVFAADQYIYVINNNALTQWGTLNVKIVFPQLVHPNSISETQWGTHRVEHFLRWVSQHESHPGNYVGTPSVIYKDRYITVPWTVFTQYGTPTVGYNVSLPVQGFESMRFGTPDVDWANVYDMQGWQSSQFSTDAWLSRSPRYIEHDQQTPATQWGVPKLYNLRQYLIQFEDPNWDKPYNRGFGPYTYVFNKRRYMEPEGWLSDRFSVGTDIVNTAWAVLPSSIPPTAVPTFDFISLWYRHVYPDGKDSLWVSWYNAIYNAAQAVYPSGWFGEVVPKVPSVVSNLQTIKHHSGSTTEWGDHLVADRVRTITQLFSRNFMRFGTEVRVDLHEQFIYLTSIDNGGVGSLVVLGPFLKEIKPRWIKQGDTFGEANVKNFFPQAWPRGVLTEQWGHVPPRISFFLQPAEPSGFGPDTRFGRLSIKDRRQWFYPLGQQTLSIPVSHRVALANPYLPSTQLVLVEGFAYNTVNISDPNFIGRPTVQGMPHPIGWKSSEFSRPWVRLQGCITRWDWPSSTFQFGTPILNPTQFVKEINGLSSTQWGKPRFTPHTIWCRLDTPQQARANHDDKQFYEIDVQLHNSPGPWWGIPKVSSTLQRVFMYHDGFFLAAGGWVSKATVEHFIRKLQVTGFKSTKFGWPELPATKLVFAGQLDTLAIGSHAIMIDPNYHGPQYATATTGNQFYVGQLTIELKNRPIYPQGFVATQWGDNNPMVHFPRHVYPVGDVLSNWGDARVEYKIRHIEPQGFDSFVCEDSFGEFTKGWLRIKRINSPVRTAGNEDSVVGFPSISLATQRIYPFQIVGSKCISVHTQVTRG